MIDDMNIELKNNVFIKIHDLTWEKVFIQVGNKNESGYFNLDDLRLLKRTLDFVDKEMVTLMNAEANKKTEYSPSGY